MFWYEVYILRYASITNKLMLAFYKNNFKYKRYMLFKLAPDISSIVVIVIAHK